MDDIYEPQEDSFLLEKYVKQFAKGIVLDVGTGSAIQAKAALSQSRVEFVFAIDINPKAVQECNKIKSEKLFCIHSDLFDFFKKRYIEIVAVKLVRICDATEKKNTFDTIIFNAPYLPDEEKDRDIALDGGEFGHETIARFLKDAKDFLSDEGVILLIFSSHTGKDQVDSLIEDNKFTVTELEKIHIFFEDIYCYKIQHGIV